MTTTRPSKLRTLLILGRTSNLPTVWSNCLAGWWLGGGGDVWALLLVCFSTTLLYIGGMFLNDAFDADFDRQFRSSRPIPSGAITEEEVWQWGISLLLLGTISMIWMGPATVFLTLALVACILLYDAVHKAVSYAPVLMAACRFFLYLTASSVSVHGVTGNAVWCALGLACYIVGLSYVARKESTEAAIPYWPALFLLVPIGLAWLIDDDTVRLTACLFSVVLLGWIGWSLHFAIGRATPNIGATVSKLLAGIVLVDLLNVADHAFFWPAFVIYFILALLFQRFIPAT